MYLHLPIFLSFWSSMERCTEVELAKSSCDACTKGTSGCAGQVPVSCFSWWHADAHLFYTLCIVSDLSGAYGHTIKLLVINAPQSPAFQAPSHLRQLFLTEIGADHDLGASFGGVAAALKAELLLPLRALNECGPLSRTMTGAPLPAEEIGGWPGRERWCKDM